MIKGSDASGEGPFGSLRQTPIVFELSNGGYSLSILASGSFGGLIKSNSADVTDRLAPLFWPGSE
jgi:hypothetical protein